MPNLIILVGPPGSGKTYITNRILAYNDYVVISSDDIIQSYADDEGITYSEAFPKYISFAEEESFREYKQTLKLFQNIIVDRTNMTVKSRSKYLRLVPTFYHKTAIVMDWKNIPEDEYNSRLTKREEEGKIVPRSVIQDMKNRYEPPTLEEGFDEVILGNKYS